MKISGSFSDYLSFMLSKPRMRLNNLKTSLEFPCLGLSPIIDFFCLTIYQTNAITLIKLKRHISRKSGIHAMYIYIYNVL